MSEYVKGALSIPSLILIIGAIGLIAILFVCLMAMFNSVKWVGPSKMFDDQDNFRLRYFTNRTSMASAILVANSAWKLLWVGGWGIYVTRTNRGGYHEQTPVQSRLHRELDRTVSDDYRKWLEQFDEDGNLEPSE
ncbi:UNVERIFIED_ORG: hypothetical protein M2328_006116 [Rhodococcus erythropolis]